jgi:RNA polymerase sigma-70 factor (ECF subfamily)
VTDTGVERWFDEHFEYVVRTLLRLGAPSSDVEDLAQEVFVVVHRRLQTFDPSRPARPWLFGIAAHVLRDWRKRASTRHEVLALEAPADTGRTDPGIRKLEAAQLVHRALRAVPEERREVFVLHELDQISIPEVARALGLPVDTAYSRLRVAREEFRAAVARLQRGAA